MIRAKKKFRGVRECGRKDTTQFMNCLKVIIDETFEK
jgi:hypothetical protein